MNIILTLRRNRISMLLINYIIMAIIFVYLLVIGYQGSTLEIHYSRMRASARENGATDDEVNQINAEQDEVMDPYIYKYKVVAAILLPITLFTIGLFRLEPPFLFFDLDFILLQDIPKTFFKNDIVYAHNEILRNK